MSSEQSSEKWLKDHGLEASGVSLPLILRSLGFKQCSGEVPCLGHSVASQYGTGLFLQHPDQEGTVYNLVDADKQRLESLELKLTAVIATLKTKLECLRCQAGSQSDERDVQEELEKARDTLAQVQALHMEVKEKEKAYHTCRMQPATEQPQLKSKLSSSGKEGVAKVVPPKDSSNKPQSKHNASHSEKISPSHSGKISDPHSPKITTQHSLRIVTQQSSRINASCSPKIMCRSKPAIVRGRLRSSERAPQVTEGISQGVGRGTTVLAPCHLDGFYYRGVVTGDPSRDGAEIEFCDGDRQKTLLSQLVLVGGACTQPHLRTGDYVLCGVRSRQGLHSSVYGVCDFYIPAQVEMVLKERGSGVFSVAIFRGDIFSCPRSSLVKISEARYSSICHQLLSRGPAVQEEQQLPKVDETPSPSDEEESHVPLTTVAASQCAPETEEKATCTEPCLTEERGVGVWVTTLDKAVGTGPQLVDQSTTTSSTCSHEDSQTLEYTPSHVAAVMEAKWSVRQTVIARRESDGVYYPAEVKEQLAEGERYRVQWADGSVQEQTVLHMFGPLTQRRALQPGDHVLALAMPGIGACLPGTVTGSRTRDSVEIKFSDGERQLVREGQCFWISPAYFLSAVEYISELFNNQ